MQYNNNCIVKYAYFCKNPRNMQNKISFLKPLGCD